MTISELKDAIFEIVAEYFKGAIVSWLNQSGGGVKPKSAFVKLTLGNFGGSQHSQDTEDEETNEIYQSTPSDCYLTVDLFTHGKEVNTPSGTYYEDTATNDLDDFVNYMESDYVLSLCDKYNITIQKEGKLDDLSAVVDTSYEYRARQLFTVMFMREAHGEAGISRNGWKQTPSGGGSKELADKQNIDVDADKLNVLNNL